MKKPVVIGIIVAVIVLAGVGFLLMNNNSNDTPAASTSDTSTTTNSSSNESTNSSNNSTTPTATDKVSIKDFAFSPADITVKGGTTVTWTNNDSTTHTVTETDGQTGPNSGNLEPGKSYTFTYATAGTFKYHCSIHSSMTGTVTVTQ